VTEEELKPVRAQLDAQLRVLRAQSDHDPIPAEGPLPAGVDPVVGDALRGLMSREPRKQGPLGVGVRDDKLLGHDTSDPLALGRVVRGDFSLRTQAEAKPDPSGTVAAGPVRASGNNPVLARIEGDIHGGGKHVDLSPTKSPADVGTELAAMHAKLAGAKDEA
jgi:hypothetical protein